MNAIAVGEAAAPGRVRGRFFGTLYVQVILAIGIGAAIGYFAPATGVALKPWGDAFIKAIKAIVAPIVFVTVVIGIAKMGSMRKVAVFGAKALIYFEVVSTLALIIGMTV